MADSKLSALTSATEIQKDDLFYIVQSGTSKKVIAGKLALGKRYTNASVSGSLALDLDTYDTFNLTLTGATTLSISETLQTDEVKPFTIYVTGDFALTLTGFTIWSGAYDGTLENRITAEQDTSSTIVADIQTKA